jgi:hypothetical protein
MKKIIFFLLIMAVVLTSSYIYAAQKSPLGLGNIAVKVNYLRVPYSIFQKQLSGQPKGVIFTEIDSIDEEFRESSLRRGT